MTHRLSGLLLALSLLATLALSGCSRQSAKDPAQAKTTLVTWLAALKAHTDADVYQNLTPTARKYISKQEAAAYLAESRVEYGEVGEPEEVAPGIVRIPVKNLAFGNPRFSLQWPETRITVRYESGRWSVAWTQPLWEDAMLAYGKKAFDNELSIAKQMAEIDPYNVHAHEEQYFALRHLGKTDDAKAALDKALQVADPVDKPDVLATQARFALETKRYDDAIRLAEQALEGAKPYLGSYYTPLWQSTQFTTIGSTYLTQGDKAKARAYALQALNAASNNVAATDLLQLASQ